LQLTIELLSCHTFRQTAKLQVTDIRFARIGKASLQMHMAEQRKLKRMRACADGTAPELLAGAPDLIRSMEVVHQACVQDNARNNSVLASFRAAGAP